MRPFNDIEKFVRRVKPIVLTGEQMDKQTLDDSYAAMEETIKSSSKGNQSSIFGFAVRKRAMKLLAAAAIIIIVIGFLLVYPAPDEKTEIVEVADSTKSPAEMLTAKSLMTTYRHDGMEAMETQMDEAIEKLEPHTVTVTVQELLAEINGT